MVLLVTHGVRLEIPAPAQPFSMFLVRGGEDMKIPPDGTLSVDGWIVDTVFQQMEFRVTAAGGTTNQVVKLDINDDVTRYTYEGGTTLVEMTYRKSLGHRWSTEYDRPVLNWLLSLPADPALRIEGTNVVVTYPSGILQSTESVTGQWSDVPGAVSPYPSPITSSARYFRTRQ